MKMLRIALENCYGIKKLDHQFDFSKGSVYAIYAQNGMMKSSFAQTFMDLADDKPSQDRVFPARVCKRLIKDETGTDLAKGMVVVVRPYDEVMGHTEKTSTLLVDSKLREEYENLHADIDKSKEIFLKAMKGQSGSKKDLEREISTAFTKSDQDFYRALLRVKEEVLTQKDAPFAEVLYDKIFDDKVLGFLGTKDFKTAIADYVKKYNELLAASTYFKKGIFNYYNASTIAKNLADNGFFNAKHTVTLNGDIKVEISTEKQLEELIAKEKEAIFKDEDLRKKYAELEKLISKNITLRDFNAYLEEHEELLPKLDNIEAFKEELWKSYFYAHLELYKDLVTKYQDAEKRKKEIEEAAAAQRTQWETVIEIFNRRFFVPFKLEARNRVSVILGQDPLLNLGFVFEDGADTAPVDKTALMQVLSTGEKKSLYILNIIFEVEARKKAKQPTVFIVDDIADSFDYKNKYAIIEYLKEISEEPYFKQIILSHNFDFFRTIESRFVPYPNCLMAFKGVNGVTLEQATGIKNVFVNDWRPNFFKHQRKKIASIPFIRNIIEYTKGGEDLQFRQLTSLLHWKADTTTITHKDLDGIYISLFGGAEDSSDGTCSVLDTINSEALDCLKAGDGINFENKIVLSIATRLVAEKYMVEKLADPDFVSSIGANQTAKLFGRFKSMFATETATIETLQRVILMTPESIHLNSFMYEPILDMSDCHLRKLYEDVVALV